MLIMKNETTKERNLRKKLEKKHRKWTQKLQALGKKLRELAERRDGKKPRKAKPKSASGKKGKAKGRVVAKKKKAARTGKTKSASRKVGRAVGPVAEKPKKTAGKPKRKASPKKASKVIRRAPRKAVPPSPTALVSAVSAVPTQGAPSSSEPAMREGDAGSVT